MGSATITNQTAVNPVGLPLGEPRLNISLSAAADSGIPFAVKDPIELGRIIEELPELERLVLSLHYYEGLDFNEIGMVLDLRQSNISSIHDHAIFSLKTCRHFS